MPLHLLGPGTGAYVVDTGAWQANHAYSVNQSFTNSGTRYLVTTAYTSGTTFGSADTSNTVTFGNSSAGVAIAFYTGGAYPLRSTVSSSVTQPVEWVGPVAPTIGSGYALTIDFWTNTLAVI